MESQHQVDNVLTVEHLEKRIGEKVILSGITLSLGKGSGLAVIGPNGAGKTTLLRILAGIWAPSAGKVWRFGLPMGKEAVPNPEVGFLGHQSFLYSQLSAYENLVFYARLWGIANPHKVSEEALVRVGLGWSMSDPIRSFSRGMVQRAAIARAMLTRPRLLLLDEPYTGLDVPGQGLLDDVLREFKSQDGALVLITHSLREALENADAVVFLVRGRLVWWGYCDQWDEPSLKSHYQEWLIRGGHLHP